LRLFKQSVVRIGTFLMSMLGLMLFGVMFVLPIFMSRVLGFDATQTGMMFIPGALLTAVMMPLVGKALAKFDARWLIFIGIMIVETMLLTMTHYSSLTTQQEVFWSLMIRGAGMAFLFVPINSVVLGGFRGQELGQVAGLLNLLRQIGGSIGIALIDTLLERKSHQNLNDLTAHVSVLNPATQFGLSKMGVMNLSIIPDHVRGMLEMRVAQQVYIMSFVQMMWYIFFIFGCALVPLYFLPKAQKMAPGAAMDMH
jgi:DHA2 family multidrug resistance protein